jgi:hypothetical protein
MYATEPLERQLGIAPREPRGWFRSEYLHNRISDTSVLLAGHLRIYNEGLKSNELRLWNPYLLCGIPTYADPMVHPFYPPNLLLHRIFSPDVAYELGLLLHLFFSGVAMYLLLLRGAGRSPVASTAGALVWMLGGYQAMWFSTAILAGVSVFGPLALLAILRGLETRDRSRAPLAAAAMGMAILGSHPQHALLTFLFLLGWIAVAARAPETRAFTLRFAVLFGLLSVGAGLAEILARLDTIENGYRDPDFDRLSLYAEPWRLASYATGLIFGKVYFPGAGWEAEFPVYMGLAAAALAIVGAVRHWSDPRVRVAAVAGIAALAIAFLYPLAWLFSKIPLLNLSPASRCLFVAAFAIAFLVAYGVDALAAKLGRTPRGVAWIAATFAILLVVGIGPAKLSNGAAIETAIGFALATGAAFAAARWKRAGVALTFAAILFELLPPFILFNRHGDSSLISRPPPQIRALGELGGPWRATGILGTTATTTKSDQWGNDLVAGNNLLALYGVENIGGFEAIIPRWYVTYAQIAGAKISPAGRTLQFTRFDSPLVDPLALKEILLPAALPMPSRFRKLHDFGSVALFENRAALPRIRLGAKVQAVRSEDEAERLLRDPTFDARSVVVETDHDIPESGGGSAAWRLALADRLAIEVRSKEKSVLVLADTDYPGWEATVDGRPVPILRANLAFRAVETPPGNHLVEFHFRPSSARHGLIASMLFLLLSLAGAFVRRPS